MNTSEVLNKAADLIEERGWVQGESGWRDGGSLCLEGALVAALPAEETRYLGVDRLGLYQDCAAYEAVVAYLGLNPLPKMGPVKDSVWQWNDSRGRTAKQVIATLRAAAVIEAAKETADDREQVSA